MQKRVSYRAHRVVWALVHGEWPREEIDHINGVRDDNRLANLRVVSHAENGRNLTRHLTNTSGVTGVGWHKPSGRWQSYIGIGGRLIRLGEFDDFADAVAARRAAEGKYGFHKNHGKKALTR